MESFRNLKSRAALRLVLGAHSLAPPKTHRVPRLILGRTGDTFQLRQTTSNAMTHSEKQSWEQLRAKGHDRFILREGLLRNGVPLGLIVTLSMFLYDIFTHTAVTSLWKMAIGFAILVLGFGYGMGETRWRSGERDYQKPTEDDGHPP